MTREDLNCLVTALPNKCILLELATGTGKSKLAIEMTRNNTNVLLLVSKRVHKQNWIDEYNKWNGNIPTIECYNSFHKYKNSTFDTIILDEGHHCSEQKLKILQTLNVNKIIVLSATLPYKLSEWFKTHYNTKHIKCGLQDAINDDILPEPTIYFIPLYLDSTKYFTLTKFNQTRLVNQIVYYNELSKSILYFKDRYYRTNNRVFKNKWLSLAGERLKWLSEQKENYILNLLKELKNYRTLTFCNNIEQTKKLGKYNINSKNKNSDKYLQMFNNKEIKHITSCNILNESVNLVDCRIGIFCNLNSSDTVIKQRQGRLLRHKKPIIIIPYFVNTREEELIDKIKKEYNQELLKTINNINEIKF